MKSQSAEWKLPLLIGVLLIVALLINYFFFTKAQVGREAKIAEQHQVVAELAAKAAVEKLLKEKEDAEAKAAVERQKALEQAAAEHAHYLAHYLNSGFTRKPGVSAIGVAIESEQGTVNQNIAVALTRRFQSDDVQLLNSFFKPEFVADKLAANILAGQTGVFEKLELTNSLEGVLIGRQMVEYSTNSELGNTITANLQLELVAVPVGMTRESQSWSFVANGVGFRPHEARQLAEDRIIEQIAKNTNMVLAPRLLLHH